MLLLVLPLISSAVVVTSSATGAHELVAAGRVAQVRLAEVLGEADSIESVTAHGRDVTFAIVRDGAALDVTATTRRSGAVVALSICRARPIVAQLHGLTWLATELTEAIAVTTLTVDAQGAVTIGTSEGQRYAATPGRGSRSARVARKLLVR